MIHGMVLGKFLPPHVGHVHLCEVARALSDELTIVVASLAHEPIDGAVRAAWMRELVPGAQVVHHTAALPQEPSEHPAFWQLWRASLLAHLPRPPDRVFTSDAYGKRLAAELGATWVPVDPGRTVFSISGTAVRANPLRHWAAIPRVVRPYFARRISVFGPESCGKSTLAVELARALDTLHVPEHARAHLEARDEPAALPTRDDLARIVEAQIALEDTLAREANQTLICDTDPLLTCVWWDVLFGDVPPALLDRCRARRYAHTLLCDVDLPWVADPVRYRPDDRAAFFARCEAILRAADRPFSIVRGMGPARLAMARGAIT